MKKIGPKAGKKKVGQKHYKKRIPVFALLIFLAKFVRQTFFFFQPNIS